MAARRTPNPVSPLLSSDALLRAVIAAEPECVKLLDRDGTVLDMNPAGLAIVQAESVDDVLGKDLFPLVSPAYRDAARATVSAVFRGESRKVAFELVGLKGAHRWLEMHAVPLRDDKDQVIALLGITRDMTEQKLHEEAVRLGASRYQELFESAPVGIYQTTRDGQFLTVNPALARILGYESAEELKRKNIRDVYADPAERETLIAKYGPHGTAADIEVTWKRRDGTPIRIQLNARAVGGNFEGFVHDVTERAGLEEQLRQSQKMEAVGRLAGGIAHDFNNILTAITGYSELLLRDLPGDDGRRQDVQEIRAAAERAATLTRQLLAFSRKQVLQPQPIDLNAIVANVERLLARLIGEHIQLHAILDPAAGRVNADPGQIEQVIVNLAVNARDAMPTGGELTIETRMVRLGGVPHVQVAVQDSGVGMDAETQAHIFEPFFTTKAPGKGTGLGLATVYGIVKQSGGDIRVVSEPGKGATFTIDLPCVTASGGVLAAPAPEAPQPGTETVLLVEDDPAVRTLTVQVLKRLGYDVLEASGGAHALELSDHYDRAIHLLVTDVVMPEVGGRQVAEQVARRRPGIKVLYMSGYTDDAIVHHGVLERGLHYLQKPFTPAGLAQKIREVLSLPS